MIACPSCGADNVEGTRFCVKCGTTLPAAPAPEAWRQSGDLGQQQSQQSYQSGGYTPPTPPQSAYPTYNPPEQQGVQPLIGSGSQPTNPIIPALVSFLLPGLGLLFVPNKANLGFIIFGADIVGTILLLVLYFGFAVLTAGLGIFAGCCFFLLPLVNIAAAIYSYDEAAKVTNGQFKPLVFK